MSETKYILYAEDDADDIFFMTRACKRVGLEKALRTVRSGSEAIDYLSGKGEYAMRELHPMPDLVMLDLKMPEVSGFDLLKWIRSAPALAKLPVVVISSSSQESDRERASLLGANSFIVKPGKVDDLVGLVADLKNRWLNEGSSLPAGA